MSQQVPFNRQREKVEIQKISLGFQQNYLPILGSRGSLPRNGILRSSAIFSAPPVVGGKIWDSFCVEKTTIQIIKIKTVAINSKTKSSV